MNPEALAFLSRRDVPCSCKRGFIRPRAQDAWLERCEVCKGRGVLGALRLAKLLKENPSTVRRFLSGRTMARRTLVRYVGAFLRLDAEIQSGKEASFASARHDRQGMLFE